MKNLKNILIALTILLGNSLFGAERPPQPLKAINMENVSYLELLPSDIHHELLQYSYKGGEFPNITALANTIIARKKPIDAKKLLSILTSFPYTANGVDLAEQLKELPVMQDLEIQKWLTQAKAQLEGGKELYTAVENVNEESFAQLLKNKNVDLNWQNKFDLNTPLLKSTFLDFTNFTARLLAAGANPNIQGINGNTALLEAARIVHTGDKIIKLLLKAGANLNMYDDFSKKTPLMWAALYEHVQAVELLLDAGANLHAQDKFGNTALMDASQNSKDNEKIVQLLLAKGANPNVQNKNKMTALMEASVRGNGKIASVLLAAGADPKLKDIWERTAYAIAIQNNQPEVAEIVEQASAERKAKESEKK